MPIEAIDGKGVNRASLICDECGRADVVTCDYFRKPGNLWEPNVGQCIRKATGSGWVHNRGKLRCPKCEARRKAMKQKGSIEMSDTMQSAKVEMRRPTNKQERLIILALEDAYDDQSKRYKGSATDKTVADELGDGIMFGWVAEVRERLFGPSGGNEEIDAIRAEIALISADMEAKVKALVKRLDAVVTAVGPRAQRAG